MFGYKAFLKIGQLTDGSLRGLFKEAYELQSCTYGFAQSDDHTGKPQDDAAGGAISIIYPGIPPREIIEWGLSHDKYLDGTIVICDQNEQPLEKLKFEQAACVDMSIVYDKEGEGLFSTQLVLQAFSLSVGTQFLTNRWTGF